MLQNYRIALLEFNTKQLEKLESYLNKIPNVEIVLKSKTSDHFFEEVQLAHPDILVGNLELRNDSMKGIKIVQELKITAIL